MYWRYYIANLIIIDKKTTEFLLYDRYLVADSSLLQYRCYYYIFIIKSVLISIIPNQNLYITIVKSVFLDIYFGWFDNI